MPETGEVAIGSLGGDKLYERRARRAFPILVRQALAEEPIHYGALAEELEMPNPRNLNYVLGLIGNSILELSNEWDIEIPPLQAVVINKSTGLPGEGLAWFVRDPEVYRNASSKGKRSLVESMLQEVFSFRRWNDVLAHYGLTPVAASAPPAPAHTMHDLAAGESEDHLQFKMFVAQNPQAIGLPQSCAPGEVEYIFRSADAVDVLFRNGSEWIGAEVKSARSPATDIARGMYQCVKYGALLEATQMVAQVPICYRSILVLEGELPTELVPLRNTLGIEVREKAHAPRSP